MSTAACFKQVSPATLDFLIKNPEFIDSFLGDDFTEPSVNISGEDKKKEWLQIIAKGKKVEGTDTDYAWHGILYILEKLSKGEKPPINLAVRGPLKNSFAGPGIGFSYWKAEDVKSLAKSLNNISEKVFLAQYDGKDMNEKEIYLGNWEEHDGLIFKPYLWENFLEMRNYYKDAANRNYGMILYLS